MADGEKQQAASKLKQYLMTMVQNKASDLYLSTSAAPSLKINGKMSRLAQEELQTGDTKLIADAIMNERQKQIFAESKEMNLAINEPGTGRFRVNIFEQRNEVGLVIRSIPENIPTLEELGLPAVMKKIATESRGLVLVVGATGTGKSTTLAAMINFVNENFAKHIITIEDPIEFYYKNKNSIVNQREVGIDTESFENALRNTLRQAPDVILIGEIRDRDTLESSIKFSETGHLCFSTVHATSANQTIERLTNLYHKARRDEILFNLSLNIKAIVSQRLVPTIDGKRCAALEILLATPLVCDLIKRGEITGIKEVMEKSQNLGMQTFDTALVELVKQKKIDQETAESYADSANNVRLCLKTGQAIQTPTRLTLQPSKNEASESINPWKMKDG